MKSYRSILAAFVAVCFTAAAAFAADANPTGTWKWTQPGRGGGQGIEQTLKLDLKAGVLTGTMVGMQGPQGQMPDVAIGDASFKDGVVAFSVTREFNGQKRTSKFSGKLEGDKITGSTERPGRGEGAAPVKGEWVATRAK